MTDLWEDDITGEIHEDDTHKITYGLIAGGGQVTQLHVHGETLDDQPEAVAEALHGHVDAVLPIEDTDDATGETDQVVME